MTAASAPEPPRVIGAEHVGRTLEIGAGSSEGFGRLTPCGLTRDSIHPTTVAGSLVAARAMDTTGPSQCGTVGALWTWVSAATAVDVAAYRALTHCVISDSESCSEYFTDSAMKRPAMLHVDVLYTRRILTSCSCKDFYHTTTASPP